MPPFLSVVVPVYNTAQQLSRCVDSILGQDYHDYELILVNDGSTDSTPQICNRYASEVPHVSVIHRENEGAAEARNVGIRTASGRYIYFIDSDDWIEPDSLAGLAAAAEQSGADLIVFGYTKKMKPGKGFEPYEVSSELPERELKTRQEVSEALCPLLEQGIRFSLWNKIFSRRVILENDIQFPPLHRGQDIAFTLEYFKHTQNMHVMPGRVYIHEYSYVPAKHTDEVFQNHLELFEKFYHLYPGWMQREQNLRFGTRLFSFWFFFQVPKILIATNSKDQALDKLRQVMKDPTLREYMTLLREKNLKSLKLRIPIWILNSGNAVLLYYANRLTGKFERILKNIIRQRRLV